ncbi:DUF4156 domain-containing protein [Klebsiella pneumoniae]|uniref:DUF4156 domain-containing protein n=1 Tax=Klebsiella pneumoniae TaxID=573 RepID=UPI003CC936A6
MKIQPATGSFARNLIYSTKPLLGTATGKQSNWLSGQNGDEGGSMRRAANALRNHAAEMGGNVIYGVSSPTQGLLSSFVPTDSEMNGQVYKCPN